MVIQKKVVEEDKTCCVKMSCLGNHYFCSIISTTLILSSNRLLCNINYLLVSQDQCSAVLFVVSDIKIKLWIVLRRSYGYDVVCLPSIPKQSYVYILMANR